jgi:hypothetical protein
MDAAVFEVDCELDVDICSSREEDMHDLTEPSRRGGCRETKPYLDVWSLPGLLVIGAFVYLYAMFAIAAKVGAT